MEFLTELWLPILVSAVGVFIVSSFFHMALPIHKNDYKHLDNEADVLASIRSHGVAQGEYMFPGAESMKDMNNPEYIEKCNQGPVGTMIILPNGMWNMGRSLMQWFAYILVISVFTAYVLSFSETAGGEFRPVLRMAGTVSFMGYAFWNVQNSIWKGVSWWTTCKFAFDGLVYALTTGSIFAAF